MQRIFRRLMETGIGLLLAGCTTGGQDHFSTQPGKGSGWKSMSETHQLIAADSVKPLLPAQPYQVNTQSFEGIERVPEQYLRIWLPPYQDVYGNLHEESAIQTVIRPGMWRLPDPTDYPA